MNDGRQNEIVRIARAALHYGEENCISGTRGSGTVFFSGCNLKCVFCQNDEISHHGLGQNISVSRLADIFRELEDKGAHNINLVTPSHYAERIMHALDIYRPSVPVLWNCGGYENAETIRRLEGYVDIYLPDYKYSDEMLGEQLSGVKNYPAVAEAAIAEMVRQKGAPVLDDEGMMKSGVMIRHLVLPLHIRNTEGVFRRIREHFPEAWISILLQYTPMKSQYPGHPELERTLSSREIGKVYKLIDELDMENGYIQEAQSSGRDMIPDFRSLEGV